MKTLKNLLICSLVIILFINCGHKGKATNKSGLLTKSKTYKSDIGDDTIYKIEIGDKTYQLIFKHTELHESEDDMDSTISVSIVDNSTHDTLYNKIVNYNEVGDFTKTANNNYFISLISSGGGSGYSGTLFKIKITPKVVFQPILELGELSYWIFNKYGNELILFDGKWDFNSKPPESHFEAHRQNISIYKILENNVTVKKLGMTRRKHDFIDDVETINDFKRKEPVISKEIKWEDYNE
ncbi:MAG: hypothetical protein WCL51_11805 [Bacteroidota bacterium]